MKILIKGNQDRYEKFAPADGTADQFQLFFCDRDAGNETALSTCKEADILFVDAISKADRELIQSMPNLKMIHSEGVGFNGVDLSAASERGIYVCNNKGCNAGAVAEQAIMLMLELLRKGISGDQAVREGLQIKTKERAMVEGITELSECAVGLIGFGDIAKATALRLKPFGCKLYYYSPNRKSPEEEAAYDVTYLTLPELAEKSDIISIHCAVTPETIDLIDESFLSQMKPTAYVINTARGEIINNQALRAALTENRIAGAGLDTIYPEPTAGDHPLVALPEELRYKVALAPHLGGITTGSFCRAHTHMWQNADRIKKGLLPDNIVNGL